MLTVLQELSSAEQMPSPRPLAQGSHSHGDSSVAHHSDQPPDSLQFQQSDFSVGRFPSAVLGLWDIKASQGQ